ncbi:hypothetical protein B7463_g12497, partial [Scytalidium lignicola]
MLFDITLVAALLAISGVEGHTAIKSRAAASTFTLYAYGPNITGLSVFYADSIAYLGNTAPSGASVASNITCMLPSSESSSPLNVNFLTVSTTDPSSSSATWTVTANNSAFSTTPSLYIVPTNGSFVQAGFYSSSNSSSSLPTGGVTTGFMLFGNSLAYLASNGMMEQQFWAQATDTNGTWKLMWNAGGEGGITVDGHAIAPVNIKTTAPLVINDSTSN